MKCALENTPRRVLGTRDKLHDARFRGMVPSPSRRRSSRREARCGALKIHAALLKFIPIVLMLKSLLHELGSLLYNTQICNEGMSNVCRCRGRGRGRTEGKRGRREACDILPH